MVRSLRFRGKIEGRHAFDPSVKGRGRREAQARLNLIELDSTQKHRSKENMHTLSFTLSLEGVVRIHDAVLCLARFSEVVSLEAREDRVRDAFMWS